MSLTSQELNKLKIQLAQKKAEGQTFSTPSSGVKGFVKGVGKELLSGATGTATALVRGGQAVQAAIDPTKTFEDYKQTGLESLRPEQQAEIQEMLKAEDNAEKAGKLTAFIGTLLTPSGVRSGVSKVVSKVGGTVGKVASEVAEQTGKVASKVGEVVGDIITPLEKGVENTLNPTKLIPKEQLKNIPIDNIVAQGEAKSAKLDKYVKQAEKAVADYSQPTPLTLAGDKGSEALNVINNKLAKQGQLKKEALEIVGDKVVDGVPTLRTGLRDSLRESIGINIDRKTGEIVNASGRVSKVSLDPADNKMIKEVVDLFDSLGEKPTVKQLDDAIDAVQDILYKRKSTLAVPVNGKVEAIFKKFSGELNNQVKRVAGEQYRKANDKFAYFIDTRDKLNKALGAEGVRGASLMKQLFSPSGEAPRRLFEEIKKLTGIDLVEEATLAKFVMEKIGDARQASLLEEVIRSGNVSPKGFVSLAVDKLLNKLQDPIGKAKRVITTKP